MHNLRIFPSLRPLCLPNNPSMVQVSWGPRTIWAFRPPPGRKVKSCLPSWGTTHQRGGGRRHWQRRPTGASILSQDLHCSPWVPGQRLMVGWEAPTLNLPGWPQKRVGWGGTATGCSSSTGWMNVRCRRGLWAAPGSTSPRLQEWPQRESASLVCQHSLLCPEHWVLDSASSQVSHQGHITVTRNQRRPCRRGKIYEPEASENTKPRLPLQSHGLAARLQGINITPSAECIIFPIFCFCCWNEITF